MNSAQAADRIAKLEALADPARGGTPAERQVAAKKAKSLRQQFPEARSRSPRSPSHSRRATRSRQRVWVADSLGGVEWFFNIRTGHASQNVKVHHHTSPSNWKIEIEPELGDAVTAPKARRRLG